MTKKLFLTGTIVCLVAISSLIMITFMDAYGAETTMKVKIKNTTFNCSAVNVASISQANTIAQEIAQAAAQSAQQALEISQAAAQAADGQNIQEIAQIAENTAELAQDIEQIAQQAASITAPLSAAIAQNNNINCNLVVTLG